jgi:group I intron endonuclease
MGKTSLGGIYAIVNLNNGKRYIGSAIRFKQRWYVHRDGLRKGSHHSNILQRAWMKHGEDAFAFQILEVVPDRADLLKREQHYLDTLKPEYNINTTAGSRTGATNSPEHRARISAALSSPEAKAVRSAIWKGRKQSPEHIAAKAAGHESAKAACRRRKPNPPWTEEQRAKARSAALAREARIKAAGGRPAPTDEARAKMSAAGKAGAARRHAAMTPEQKAAWSEKISATKLAKIKRGVL